MTKETRLEVLAREQREFERQLPDLIRSHAGKVALFQGGEAVDFFDSIEQAYAAALGRFGLDTVFLIATVEPPKNETPSIAWAAGVTFA